MTVAVAMSRSPAGRAAMRVAVEEAARRDVELVVLVVVDTPESASGSALESMRVDVAADLAESAAPADLRWRIEVAPTRGVIAETLLDLATRAGADPLVIGTRRRSPVGKLILGSTVQRVLLDAPMPVLVARA